ncbi:hypothetical protein Pmar_PMAR012537 [Perkinsus marinus ATCC 50983]|uniref:Uncharacterized protein n=1 Tax=Perkinsus marinus (strain ATCC 50983 / TXsc) TaxID=423536 RepID=C5K7M1_PERM5|nr:hypothetical protein Pmar_PMAR012537 [Perkinsus marinus ATCC 50983]EER19556.1 hypothetical protein Pmar_PMAR012537 [Perkinsus marinus ATCC 50983]|eukprot:XP_002787760.1 hypothetical protein Pmar_PMAR012537 [Perkinsus marinus ATCC 50983]
MCEAEGIMQRAEELIREHLRRNPRIAETAGVAKDWEFRDAVRVNLGIYYDKASMIWYFKLYNKTRRGKKCGKLDVLDKLRVVCRKKKASSDNGEAAIAVKKRIVHRSNPREKGNQRLQLMEELIQDHLRRNPKISEPESVAKDWNFRQAVKERFGIMYQKTLNKCALRIICEQQAEIEGTTTAAGGRKRKLQGGPSTRASVSKQPVKHLKRLRLSSTIGSGAAEVGRPSNLPGGRVPKPRRFGEAVAVGSRSADLDRIAALRAEVESWKDKAIATEKVSGIDEAEEQTNL